MINILKNTMHSFGIIPYEQAELRTLTKKYFVNFVPSSVVMFIFPYFSGKHSGNLSKYAMSQDYHIYANQELSNICNVLKQQFSDNNFLSFVDSSPLDEVACASKAKLGVVGKNGLLITKEYGSFVFIGAILTDKTIEYDCIEKTNCNSCGLCIQNCPTGALNSNGFCKDKCLSQITQQKGDIPAEYQIDMRENNTIWGCDKCQDVCPYNKFPTVTPIEYFKTNLIYDLYKDTTLNEIENRAFLWRGIAVLQRNINILTSSGE